MSDKTQQTEDTDQSAQRLPPYNYTLRCLDAEVKTGGRSGYPCVHTEWEVVAPASVPRKNSAGEVEQFDPRGIKFMHYLSISPGGLKWQMNPMHRLLGFPLNPTEEQLNADLYKGLFIVARCSSQAEEIRDEAGQPIPDANDKPVTRYKHQINSLVRKSEPVEGVPY